MTCKYCGDEKVKWPEPYTQGALMVNPDGTEHRCKSKNDTQVKSEQQTIENTTPLQAKDFDKMQNQTLFDDGHTRAIRKLALLRGVRKALGNESEPVIGMIFNQICADLRL